MSKNIYSILNSSKNNDEEFEPISDMEVNNIMKRFKNEKASMKKRVNIKKIVSGLAAAAACVAAVAVVPAMRDSHKDNISVSNSSSANKGEASIGDSSSVNQNSFFISASAAETEEESIAKAKNGIIIPTNVIETGDLGSNCFIVGGNNIKTISLSIDKGGLYKANIKAMRSRDPRTAQDLCKYIGNEYTEPFNENRCYGFYFDEETYKKHLTDNHEDFKTAYHYCYDDYDGAVLSISVEYEDGTTDSASYTLKSGMLELNEETMQPNGNLSDGSTPYMYGIYFVDNNISANTDEASTDDSSSVNKNSFFISASAAETEEEKEEGIMITQSGENGCIPFSGSYFFVHGNNIKTVSVSIDNGELYKADYRDVRNEHKDVLAYGEYIGREYTEPFDKNRCYGFYFDEEIYLEHEADNDGNFKQAWHDCYDDLNDAVLSISVEYENGTSDSASYTLKSGMLELNKETMKPNGNFSDGSTPYIYGVYFEAN